MDGISILEAKTEERPYFFEFKKWQIMGDHPTWAKLTYDPYPNAKPEDVVRREIIGRELVLTAKLKLENTAIDISPGVALNFDGHKFAVKSATTHFLGNPDGSSAGHIIDVIGSHFLSLIEPVDAIEKFREALAASNPQK
jgi:hypothetical protein